MVSNWRIEGEIGFCHLFGSHKMVLLNANPDISTWNLLSHCIRDLPKLPCFCFVQALQLAMCQNDCNQEKKRRIETLMHRKNHKTFTWEIKKSKQSTWCLSKFQTIQARRFNNGKYGFQWCDFLPNKTPVNVLPLLSCSNDNGVQHLLLQRQRQ